MNGNCGPSHPANMIIARVACAANAQVTVSAYIKKSHATYVGAKLVCRGKQIVGVETDVIATKADDTNWENVQITFTPTAAGVVEIEAWVYSTGQYAQNYVYIDDMTITQA